MNQNFTQHINTFIQKKLGITSNIKWQSIGGGSINQAYKLEGRKGSFFIKTNSKLLFENGFSEELLGLRFMNSHRANVPNIVGEGSFDDQIYLILEWIDSGAKTSKFWQNLASQLTELHRHTNTNFGLNFNNYMGSIRQLNTPHSHFSDFFIENRLKPQVQMAFETNKIRTKHLKQFERLYKQLPGIFPQENPAAVHGDFWSGNFMCTTDEKAVFIDPAVYYGHREVDVSMSLLFGGFSEEFYRVYQELFPMEKGFENRKDYYNLYPLLIHLNLFGNPYLNSIERIVSRF